MVDRQDFEAAKVAHTVVAVEGRVCMEEVEKHHAFC